MRQHEVHYNHPNRYCQEQQQWQFEIIEQQSQVCSSSTQEEQ